MANFDRAFTKFKGIEFSTPEDALHHNTGENGLTYYGIYQSAHPKWSGWRTVLASLTLWGGDIERASVDLYRDRELENKVRDFYYVKFWSRLRLDEVESQKIAEEMFFFYINVGSRKKTVLYAQRVVGAVPDGIIGKNTIQALNDFDDKVFDIRYDEKEISHYKSLARYNPKRFGRFLKGWINRARII